MSRWGSPASRVFPPAARRGDTAQLLLAKLRRGSPSSSIRSRNFATVFAAAFGGPGGGSGRNSKRGAFSPLGWIGSTIGVCGGNRAAAAESPTSAATSTRARSLLLYVSVHPIRANRCIVCTGDHRSGRVPNNRYSIGQSAGRRASIQALTPSA